jgi:aspartate kinase
MNHGHKKQWLDVRNFIKTDANYRDAEVDWELTQKIFLKT